VSADTTKNVPNGDETPEDKARQELEVARGIERTVGEATSIEEEMLEEAAELEELAESALEQASQAAEIGEDALESGDLEEAAELEELAESAVDIAHEALAAEEQLLDDAEELEEALEEVLEDLAPAPEHALPSDEVLASLAASFPEVRWEEPLGQHEAHVAPASLPAFMEVVRDAGYSTFIDVCAVDYLRRSPRFEVVIHVLDTERPHRLRVRVGVDAAEPSVPSITPVYPGANFYEREAYDLFGIIFEGHPDLTRILLPDDWEGHPLRKDYAVGSVPVQFKGSFKAT
jgi:NADH-quinone oxidoreductase subunit C